VPGTRRRSWRLARDIDLRTWEQDQLRLMPGERLLDVGCGLGDAE
jgi:ubiquinone/menaquinone biosynthesis C-methylase UbiE